MTEAEWLSCVYPCELLSHVAPHATARKLRLFACACCRPIWKQLSDERLRSAVVAVEQFADDAISAEKLESARAKVMDVETGRGQAPALAVLMLTGQPELVYHRDPCESTVVTLAAHTSMWAATAAGAKFNQPGTANRYYEESRQSNLLKDIFGNPFRTVTLDPRCLSSAVRNIARSIYNERAFDRLPELADSLERAGCANSDLLAHCREPGPHVRGCWAIDILLAMS